MKALKKLPAWTIYTAIFAVIILAYIWTFNLTGNSLIWSFDGISQHYPILVNFRDMLVHFLHNPSNGLTHWTQNIGLGADQLTSFSYYVVGDLFNYFIVLFPKSSIELGYSILILARLYCAGLAFMLFIKTFGFKKYSVILSTLTYTFSSYALYAGMHHAFFILPLIFFPLLGYGIERIIHNHSAFPLFFAVIITFLSNFYFAYILGLGCIIYVIIRYFSIRKAKYFKLAHSLIKMLIAIVGGFAAAGLIFIPTIIYALKSTRITNTFANGYFFYPTSYYLNLPGKLIGLGGTFNFWLIIGMSGLSFLALIYVFSHFKKYLYLNITLLITIIGIMLPAFSAIFNALASPSNRWVSLSLLPIGIATAIFADHITNLTSKDLKILSVSPFVLIALIWLCNGFLLKIHRHDFNEYILLFALLGILLAAHYWHWKNKITIPTIFAIVTLNLITLGIGFYSPNSSGYSKGMLNQNSAANYVKNYYDGANKYVNKHLGNGRTVIGPRYHYIPDTRNNFINTDYFNANSNIPMILGTHDIASYLTVENGYIGHLEQQLKNNQFTQNNPVAQNDYRSSLENLMGVKYMFVRSQRQNKALPNGFKLLLGKDKKPKLFQNNSNIFSKDAAVGTVLAKNKNALPLMYLQNKIINNKDFNKLSANDKEQAMIGAANLDKKVSGIKAAKYHSRAKKLDYKVNLDDQNLLTSQKDLDNSDLTQTAAKEISPNTHYYSANRVQKILDENKQIQKDNQKVNKHGLHEITTDALGQKNTYYLNINKPSATKNAELYLDVDGIQSEEPTSQQLLTAHANRNVIKNHTDPKLASLTTFRDNISTYNNGSFVMTASAKGMSNAITQLGTDELSNYVPRHRALINLSYSGKSRKQIKLTYKYVKALHFKHARIIAVPFDQAYQKQIKRDQQNGLANIKANDNVITGISNNTKKSVLTTSIPYSTGWKLTVDGKNVKTKIVNQAFVGGVIPKGKHHIKLTYKTPGLLIGKLTTIFSLIVALIIGITFYLIKRHKK